MDLRMEKGRTAKKRFILRDEKPSKECKFEQILKFGGSCTHSLYRLSSHLVRECTLFQGWARDVNGRDRDETETLAFRDRDETETFAGLETLPSR